MCHRIILSVLSLDPVPHIVKLFVNRIVQNLNIGALHSGGTGLNHACRFKLAQRIDNHRAGDAGLVRNLGSNQNSLSLSVHLFENMKNGLNLRVGKRREC